MRFLLVLFALVLFTADADAQRRGHSSIAREGDLAITVGLVGLENLALRPLDGGIGLRYRVADRTVIGASVGLTLTDADREASSRDREDASENDFFGTSLSLWTERHIGGSRVVSPFIGLGGRVGIDRSNGESTTIQPCDAGTGCPTSTRRTESERLTASGGLLLGAEVKLVRGLTLGGAYTFGAEYSDATATTVESLTLPSGATAVGGGSQTSRGWRYGVGTTQVNLSIYF